MKRSAALTVTGLAVTVAGGVMMSFGAALPSQVIDGIYSDPRPNPAWLVLMWGGVVVMLGGLAALILGVYRACALLDALGERSGLVAPRPMAYAVPQSQPMSAHYSAQAAQPTTRPQSRSTAPSATKPAGNRPSLDPDAPVRVTRK